MNIKSLKNHKLLRSLVSLSLGLICSACLLSVGADAYSSLNGISAATSDGTFTIVELIPTAGTGSIGYYVEGQEPIAGDSLQSLTQLRAAGLVGAGAPLSEVTPDLYVLPWQPRDGADVAYDISETTVSVNGNFVAVSGGAYKLNGVLSDPDEPIPAGTTFTYVTDSSGDYNFAQADDGTAYSITYDVVYVESVFVNNNFFSSFVLDGNASPAITVTSLTPSQLSANPALLQAADLLVLSAGYNLSANSSLQSTYTASNDISAAAAAAITDYAKTKPIVLDRRLASVTAAQLSGAVNTVIVSGAPSGGFVRGNVYCFAPDAQRAQLVTSAFNSAYDGVSAVGSAYHEVFTEIQTENRYRPSADYLPENVSIATAMRHVIHVANDDFSDPSVAFTGNSTVLLPTVFGENTLSGTVLTGIRRIAYTVGDDNPLSRNVTVELFYEDADGAYYYDTATGNILPVDGASVSALRFSKEDLFSQNLSGAGLSASDSFSPSSSVINELSTLTTDSNIALYLQATTTIGYRPYVSLSTPLTLQKLGLLKLG